MSIQEESDILVLEKTKVKIPSNYKVVLLNDNKTSFEFVIDILMHLFGKSLQDAIDITTEIHEKGRGLAGIYPHEIAESKAYEVREISRKNNFPLVAEIEPE